MKCLLGIFMVLAVAKVSIASPLSTVSVFRNLKNDLEDFLKIVPVEKIENLFYDYLSTDEQFQEALDYLMSAEFADLVMDVEQMPEIRNFAKFLADGGFPVYDYVNQIHEYLGMPKVQPMRFRAGPYGMGIKGFIAEVRSMIDFKALENLYNQKLQTSPDFARVVKRLSSQESQEVIEKLFKDQRVITFLKRAKQNGVDIEEIFGLASQLLGLKFPSLPKMVVLRSLQTDFDDFLRLIPVEAIENLFYDYLSTDEQFQEAVDYLMSAEFAELVNVVEHVDEIKKFYQDLNASGFPVYEIVNQIHEYLGMAKFSPFRFRAGPFGGGIKGFIAEVRSMVDFKALENLYNQKLQTSPEFAAIVKRLGNEESQEVVNRLSQDPRIVKFIRKARENGVDVQEILNLASSFLGLKFPDITKYAVFRTLEDDLQDFLALIPVARIENLFYDYLSSDADFQEAIDYLMSAEFANLVMDVENMPESRDFLKFVYNTGFPVYDIINQIHDYLGMAKIHPMRLRAGPYGTGVKGFIAEVRSMINFQALDNLYKQKLQTSPQFQRLVERLSNDRAQNFVNKMANDARVLKFLRRAKDNGVDVQEVLDLASAILGIKFPESDVYHP